MNLEKFTSAPPEGSSMGVRLVWAGKLIMATVGIVGGGAHLAVAAGEALHSSEATDNLAYGGQITAAGIGIAAGMHLWQKYLER